jgi:hypothetical protein
MLAKATHLIHATVAIGLTTTIAPADAQVTDENLKLLASDGAPDDRFGRAVAINDGIVAVGAFGHNPSGSAYLFDADTGALLTSLLPSDGAPSKSFGFSIAIVDGIVAVGAPGDGSGPYPGAVYLFNAFTGVQLSKLVPADGAAGDRFGFAVAIDGGLVAVAAFEDTDNGLGSGSAYVFDAFNGDQITKLLPSDGRADDHFGMSISISDGVVAVGAPYNDDNGADSGSAYLFDAYTGMQLAKLVSSDGTSDDSFGQAVTIVGNVLVVGASNDDASGDQSGSAYLFDSATGIEIAKLMPSDGVRGAHFGQSASIDHNVVTIGAQHDDNLGSQSGSAYLFDTSTGEQIGKLIPSDGAPVDGFGVSIAITGDLVTVGATGDDDNGLDAGAAYVLDFRCPVDLTNDDHVDTRDFISFFTFWAAMDPRANWKIDHAINTQDFIAYLDDWATGCP